MSEIFADMRDVNETHASRWRSFAECENSLGSATLRCRHASDAGAARSQRRKQFSATLRVGRSRENVGAWVKSK